MGEVKVMHRSIAVGMCGAGSGQALAWATEEAERTGSRLMPLWHPGQQITEVVAIQSRRRPADDRRHGGGDGYRPGSARAFRVRRPSAPANEVTNDPIGQLLPG